MDSIVELEVDVDREGYYIAHRTNSIANEHILKALGDSTPTSSARPLLVAIEQVDFQTQRQLVDCILKNSADVYRKTNMNDGENVVGCFVESMESFCCKVVSFAKGYQSMMQRIQMMWTNAIRLEAYPAGIVCLVKWDVDGNWYRSLILRVYADSRVQVQFVDFGNYENVVINQITSLHYAIYNCQHFA